ncbi:MAG: glycerophosphodiester phosphodiesterase [Sphaerochaetaceae bacterium]|nr:glycerophosphodiester phosphodiesterase [Sphaerochaetaceae bacterium]
MSNIYELFDNDKIFVLGHRGFSEEYPENTMVSFQACADEEGVDGVELDIHRCKSGELVVCHDFNIKRTTGVDRNVEDMTWDEIKNLDAGSFKDPKFSGARIPLLQELFSSFSDRFCYDIEIKAPKTFGHKAICNDLWQMIQDYKLESSVMVSSFNPVALRRFNRTCWYSVPTADIFCDDDSIPKAVRHGNGRYVSGSSYLKPERSQVTESNLNKWKKPVISWTINTVEEAERILALPYIKGLIGNNPLLIRGVLEALKK